MAAIEVRDLFKSYGPVDAVRGISFRVEEGEVFALLGPNGAGKTTTLEILEGHRTRSGGQVSVLGVDPQSAGRSFRERIGIVLQSAGIDAELSVREVLALYAECYPRPLPVADVVALVGLGDKARARVKTLSGGQRRRLDLALALVGDPDLIFLDEPTTGFDPAARRGAWQLVESLCELGRTIVLTSHYMDEVQHLADRAVLLAGGRIVAAGSPDALRGSTVGETVISFRLADPRLLGQLPGELRRLTLVSDGQLAVRTTDPTRVLWRLCGWAVDRGVELEGLEVGQSSLEDAYLQLTGDESGGRD
jgi:ABC-2 type transport system ATP-binding protein